ncbi:MAG: DUF1178 family protein [Sphingopyxis sp.]|jgi:hypothetical protein|nr:DUF1178 family protein [Sphingopyxis sp.]
MIAFDLKCGADHVFEAWFRSSTDYEDQSARGLLLCPLCADTAITKAVMAPNVAAKGNQRSAPTDDHAVSTSPPALTPGAAMMAAAMPPEMKAALATIARVQAETLAQSRWVGRDFAKEARAQAEAAQNAADNGELPSPISPIHGQATAAEAEALIEDGIGVMPLLIPVIPPDERH